MRTMTRLPRNLTKTSKRTLNEERQQPWSCSQTIVCVPRRTTARNGENVSL